MSTHPNVLFIGSGFDPKLGGPCFSEASLCKALEGVTNVEILCERRKVDRDFIAKNLIKLRSYTAAEAFVAWLFRGHWLGEIIRQADIVHLNGHWNWKNCLFARICTRHRVPYVFHPRGTMIVNQRRPLLKRLFNFTLGNRLVRRAAKVVALSQFETKQFAGYPLNESQIAILPNGIGLPEKVTDGSHGELASPYFLYFGRLEERKNLLFLVDAFADYVKAGGAAKLYLMGPVERNYDAQVLARIRKLGLEDRAEIRAAVYDDKKWSYLKAATAVIYPSVDEPFGRVPFEALGVGTPAIVPDRSGGAEYLASILPEAIYPNDDRAALVAALFRFSGRDEILRRRISEARGWVIQNLNWPRIANRVLGLYAQALPKQTPETAARASN